MKIKNILTIWVVAAALTPSLLLAEGAYLGFGFGLHFNLGDLGRSITNDGQVSNVGNPALTGHKPGAGCPTGDQNCMREIVGHSQWVIVPEKMLNALPPSTNQAFGAKTEGTMTGGVLNVFWEKEGENTFFRVGVDYTRKIIGGTTESTLAGIKWYRNRWDYKSIMVPFYFGLKAKVGESSAVYGGGGLNYFQGGWTLEGHNVGDVPTYLTGLPIGAITVVDAAGQTKGGPIIGDKSSFWARGVGFNFVVGIETTNESGNKWFFEIDNKIAFQHTTTRMSTPQGAQHLAPFISFPQNLSGIVYRCGYKLSM